MNHSFDIEIARVYGIEEAILLNNFWFLIENNMANNTNYHDGKYWAYNSVAAYAKLFPYISAHKIRRALDHLVEEEILEVDVLNEIGRDRTRSFTITEKGLSVLSATTIELAKTKNVRTRASSVIFTPPTYEEVGQYCLEENYCVSPQAFIDFYQARGWKVGRDKMKDWKAAVRTWQHRRDEQKKAEPTAPKDMGKGVFQL